MNYEIDEEMNFEYQGVELDQIDEIEEYQFLNPLAKWIVCDGEEIYEFTDQEYENYKFQKAQEIQNYDEDDDFLVVHHEQDYNQDSEDEDDDDKSIV